MSTGQVSAGYAIGAQAKRQRKYPLDIIKPVRKVKESKLTLKQRFRDWLNDSNEADQYVNIPQIEESRLHSDGIRLQIYKASGGYVVETRGYDSKTDRNRCNMHVINDDQDLGDALGKIVMMEALR